MDHLRIGEAKIAYEEEGKGMPIVFLNGILMSIASWQPQRDYFSKTHRCILHDFQGQLLSSKGLPRPDMQLHAEGLKALLDALEVERCHLVGTSYGGEVALLFAHAYPERVRSMSIIASVSYSDELLKKQVTLWRDLAGVSAGLLYDALASFSYCADFFLKNPEYIESRRQKFLELPEDFFPSFQQLCDAFLAFEFGPDKLQQIQCPTQLIAAEEDILKLPRYSEYMALHIPGARLKTIKGAGHAVVMEQPERINRVVSSFIEKL